MDELAMQQIIVQQGNIIFNDFERIRLEAIALAEKINLVEVDDENIKQSKKMLAAVNNKIKELETRRIEIKKAMLEPYNQFETQVKEIVGIVKDAEEVVRQQVKQLEEMDRQHKQQQLEEIFESRIKHYSFRNLFGFSDFLKPKHLNKTQSIEVTEKEMVDFLQRLATDMKVIETLPNAEAILSAYIETKDLAVAMTLIAQEEQRRRQIEASQAINKNKQQEFLFAVFTEKDAKLVGLLLKQENIKFEVRN
jgi:hypothetical protein